MAVLNINTPKYWDGVYAAEGDRQRVDAVRLGALERWVRICEGEIQRSARVLDFGCGRGDALFGLWASRADRTLVGVDCSPVAIEAAQAERWSLGAHDARFYVGGSSLVRDVRVGLDATETEPAVLAERFDVIWCGETLEHLDDPWALIDRFGMVLECGGFLVLSTPFKGRNRSPEHVHEFSPENIVGWANRLGELVFLDCCLLPGWLTMFAVIRRGRST